MKKSLTVAAFAVTTLAALAVTQVSQAQTKTLYGDFVYTNDPDGIALQTNEVGTRNNRSAALIYRCDGTSLEVRLETQIRLTSTATTSAPYQYDNARASTVNWTLDPEFTTLLLPEDQNARFLFAGLNARILTISALDSKRATQRFVFSMRGFKEAIANLPCAATYNLATGNSAPANPVTSTPPAQIIDPTVAFIAPLEFAQTFGGTFTPENGQLMWEYAGTKLMLGQGTLLVSSAYDGRVIQLPRAVQEYRGRTIVPARLVSAFNCRIAQTRPTDAVVSVTCGAGETLMQRNLKRY
jgi:hypothetical protein